MVVNNSVNAHVHPRVNWHVHRMIIHVHFQFVHKRVLHVFKLMIRGINIVNANVCFQFHSVARLLACSYCKPLFIFEFYGEWTP